MQPEYNENEEYKGEDLIETEQEARKRRRAEKKRRKHYKFSDKRHSKLGIASCIIAILALAAIVVAIVIATKAKGAGGDDVGLLGFAAFVLSLAGFVCAIITFFKKEVFYRFAWIGVIANGIIWMGVACIMMIGI